jgi:RNA-binding protein
MEITGKQRAQLRAMANPLPTILQIGKDGIGENLIRTVNDALEARELIKLRVLETAPLSAREACEQLTVLTRSEAVQVIGTRFILYRESHTKDKDKRIVLIRGRKTKPTTKA